MKKFMITTMVTTLLISNANAFDDKKEGLMLGVGIGASSIKTTYTGGNSRDTGFATSLKLGYGFNEKLAVYFGLTGDTYKYDSKDKAVNTALSGVGVDYYLEENSPFYLTGMVGFGSVNELKNNKSQTGYGFLVGAGYEVSKHITLQADYMKINTNDKLNADTDALRLTVNYTWY